MLLSVVLSDLQHLSGQIMGLWVGDSRSGGTVWQFTQVLSQQQQ